MSKRNIVVIISCAVTFVALMALAAFYDLKLSIAIGDKNSLYGEFFGKFGEMPTYFGIPAAALILYQAVTKTTSFISG